MHSRTSAFSATARTAIGCLQGSARGAALKAQRLGAGGCPAWTRRLVDCMTCGASLRLMQSLQQRCLDIRLTTQTVNTESEAQSYQYLNPGPGSPPTHAVSEGINRPANGRAHSSRASALNPISVQGHFQKHTQPESRISVHSARPAGDQVAKERQDGFPERQPGAPGGMFAP